MKKKSLTRILVNNLNRSISSQDRYRASLHFLDWIGCSFLGSKSEVGKIFTNFYPNLSGGRCSAIGGGLNSVEAATFINGSLGNIFEMDDIHRTSILHPGPVVIPAALAAAQDIDASYKDFLDSVVLGYETMVRLGQSVGKEHYKFFHNTATCGSFGSGIASGKIYGLNDDQLVNTLGNCGSLIGGLWQMRNENVMTKQLHNAHAARAGLTSALLAKAGLTGPDFILEGPQGIYSALCEDADPDKLNLVEDGVWKIYDTSFKPWAACRHAHPVIDATLNLREKINFNEIEKVVLKTYQDAVKFCNKVKPETILEAKFSLHHVFAVSLIDGPPSLSSFDPDAFNRSDVRTLREKTEVQVCDVIEKNYPEHYGAEVIIKLKNNKSINFYQKDALGDPGNPINDDAVIQKFKNLMGASQTNYTRINNIIDCVLSLSKNEKLNKLKILLDEKNE